MTKRETISRRTMLQRSGVAGGALMTTAAVSNTASGQAPEPAQLEKGAVVLFQGDSITDAGRDKALLEPNDAAAFGRGYALMAASALLGAYPLLNLKCYNRGISGNKVPDLAARWQADTIDLKPDVLSILIGVNDFWHKFSGRYEGTVADYEQGFTELLASTREALPDMKLVICEPFVLRCGSVDEQWFPEIDQRREAAKRVADAAGAVWVPFQTMFDEAITEDTPPEYWAKDGVHPTMEGHALMADTWLKSTGLRK